jgi:hypothetical protein
LLLLSLFTPFFVKIHASLPFSATVSVHATSLAL